MDKRTFKNVISKKLNGFDPEFASLSDFEPEFASLGGFQREFLLNGVAKQLTLLGELQMIPCSIIAVIVIAAAIFLKNRITKK